MRDDTPTLPAIDDDRAENSIAMAIGQAVASARADRKLSMRALATEAGISQPFLSQIENGRTLPSMLTLYRLAAALGLSAAELMPTEAEPAQIHVIRRDDARKVSVSEAPDAGVGSILTAAGRRVVATEYIIGAGDDMGDWFQSDGELLVYIAAGRVIVTIDGRGEWELGAGDAMTYPGALRNVWRAVGAEKATILLVHSPD
ncbi:XRE family transcriptional regulator [Microbacterium sp. LRZ72]|uniref:helix-turn-helix domain-containing protein n=1 Tax=Microbacterium sp. LRZ72 TaxID=2942481 RepID=UPI0029A6DFEF|nr:XRE family transcriptional regulator [Microbacterium sp. LRZ72]MDX2377116.1 XRE family transcriptional regulator [Microbacterium sp. LRZ72]